MERAQAEGDMHVLCERNRRALHLHLRDNTGETLTELSKHIYMVARKVSEERNGIRRGSSRFGNSFSNF